MNYFGTCQYWCTISRLPLVSTHDPWGSWGPFHTFLIVWHEHEMGDHVCPVWAHPAHGLGNMPLASRTRAEKKESTFGLSLGSNIKYKLHGVTKLDFHRLNLKIRYFGRQKYFVTNIPPLFWCSKKKWRLFFLKLFGDEKSYSLPYVIRVLQCCDGI